MSKRPTEQQLRDVEWMAKHGASARLIKAHTGISYEECRKERADQEELAERHYRTRYTIDKVPALSEFERIIGRIWAVSDHQTGKMLARNISYDAAHRLIDRITGQDTEPDFDFDDVEPLPNYHTRVMKRAGAFGGR